MSISKGRLIRGLLYIALLVVLLVGGLFAVAFAVTLGNPAEAPIDLTYSGIVKGISEGNLVSMIIWVLMDFTEAQFWSSAFATLGLFIGAFVAHILDRRNSKYAGFNICYGTHLWPHVFAAQILTALVSNIAYIRLVPLLGWWPTFVAIVSAPIAVVFKTKGNWKYILPSIIIGGLYTPALARAIWMTLSAIVPKVGVVVVIGNVAAMAVISWMLLEILYRLPGSPTATPASNPSKETKVEEKDPPSKPTFGVIWFVRRVLADFTEPQFYGNEWATIGFFIGGILTWFLIPEHQFYGVKWWPFVFAMQLLTVSVGILLYRHQYMKLGWFPTFVPAVSLVPGNTLFYVAGGYPDWVIIQAGLINAVLGGILGGPIAQFINDRLPPHQHPVVGNTASMAITTFLSTLVTSFLLLYPWRIA